WAYAVTSISTALAPRSSAAWTSSIEFVLWPRIHSGSGSSAIADELTRTPLEPVRRVGVNLVHGTSTTPRLPPRRGARPVRVDRLQGQGRRGEGSAERHRARPAVRAAGQGLRREGQAHRE